jgi:hypothetical protein
MRRCSRAAIKDEFILHPEETYVWFAAKCHSHHVALRRVAAAERWMEQRRKQSYTCTGGYTERRSTASPSTWQRAISIISKSPKSSIRL